MENQYSIKGVVRQSDGNPLSHFQVVAYDRDLRTREYLGEAVTGKDGRYEIFYLPQTSGSGEECTADIFIEVFAGKDTEKETLLAASETLFNAPEAAVIDVTVPAESYPPLSEYERLARSLQPLHDGISPAELEENNDHQDITFLHGETGWDKNVLTSYALAHRFSVRSGLAAEFWYALLNQPGLLEAAAESLAEKTENIMEILPSISEKAVREQLAGAFAVNEINAALKDETEEWLELYHDFLLGSFVQESGSLPLKKALELSNISSEKQDAAIAAYLKNAGTGKNWVDTLPENSGFTNNEVSELKTTFTLSEVALGNFGLVAELKEQIVENDLSSLARLTGGEWEDLVAAHETEFIMPELPEDLAELTAGLNRRVIAKRISENFRRAYPTVAFAAELERDRLVKEVPFSEDLSEFLQQNQDFDLLSSRVDTLMVGAELRQELRGIQRIFKLTDDYRLSSILLSDNIHSAQQIYAMGEGQFLARYQDHGIETETLKAVYSRAAGTHAAAMALVGELKALENAQSVAALNAGEDIADLFPNWKTLFGAADVCECEHCRSVYSPGAYFADILMFLKHRNAAIGSVKDVLFARRPDLGYLELSCENANTELPYIDVVCEVLEEAIVPSVLFTLSILPAPGTVSAAVIVEFWNQAAILIAPDAVVNEVRESAMSPVKAYTLRDDRHSFRIALDKKVFEMHQTRGGSDELAALPQYVNAAAYGKLKSAFYPMSLPADYINKDLKPSLPFDLFSEEMRAYLDKHGIKRWELMQTYQGNDPPNDASAGDIASEYFGISIDKDLVSPDIDEQTIILGQSAATLNSQRNFWGEPAAGSAAVLIDRVGKVNVFLDKTGLEYNDLYKLLDLSFINPGGNIQIVHDDSTCDTSMKHLSNLDLAVLDRVHRFVRFWRKLNGWQLWELDLVLMHPAIGNGTLDEAFLIQLQYFAELKNRLELSVEETSALFARFAPGYVAGSGISIESKFVEPFHDRAPSLYENLFLNKKKTNPLDPDFAIEKVTAVPPSESLVNNKLVIIAALKLREADLDALISHEVLGGPNTLSLGNLSRIYRHAVLSRALQMKTPEYLSWLEVSATDLDTSFISPKQAFNWWQITPAAHALNDIKTDELNYVLRADLTAKAAPAEKPVSAFLTKLRKDLKAIKNEYDESLYEALDTTARLNEITAAVNALEAELIPIISDPVELAARLDELRNTLRRELMNKITEILRPLLQKTGRTDAEIDLILAVFRNDLRQEIKIPAPMPMPVFPLDSPAAFDPTDFDTAGNPTAGILSFNGMMYDADLVSLQALSTDPLYVEAIGEMHRAPRLWVKFLLPFVAEAPLALLPAVDLTLLPKNLADKISFDGERSLLVFKGIMSLSERNTLSGLSADGPYRGAITSLYGAPVSAAAGIWRTAAQIPPVETDNVKIFKDATVALMDHFTKTLSDTLAKQLFAESLALAPDLTQIVLERKFALFANHPLLETFTDAGFVDSQNAIVRADIFFTPQFERYYWLHRLSWLIRTLDASAVELNWLIAHSYKADNREILNFLDLPVNNSAAAASYGKFLNLCDLFELQNSHSAETLTVFDIIDRLDATTAYTATAFGIDMHLLHEEWTVADVEKLADSLDLVYRADYVFVSAWQRLIKALTYTQKLSSSAESIIKIVDPTVGPAETKMLKEMLRASYGDEQWFELSKDIQNILRNRKRDSLVAYLLMHPAPPDNPTSKWENVNDLYAYYLLDVQMSDCLATSRLVQGSGSVQLFVQRCFMGLEPQVRIDTRSENADIRWLQWEWMKKYQGWVANRKIFLYPENWIEPELRRDKSPFFADLENELQQNEINKDTVETAFINYIDKLDNVAQLEIAGFYYEEAKDIYHVFGRTALADPRVYYYRQFDENRGTWSPWAKIDVDITGDYLISTMINERLYIFWPVFTEEPEPIPPIPIPVGSNPPAAQPPYKRLKVQIGVSEYRAKKWQPKKLSADYVQTSIYQQTADRSHYIFRPIDRLKEEGKFLIQCETVGSSPQLSGCFEVFGCKGIPERSDHSPIEVLDIVNPVESIPLFMKPTENNDRKNKQYFALRKNFTRLLSRNFAGTTAMVANPPQLDVILEKTPGLFRVTRASEPSFFDRLFVTNPYINQVFKIYRLIMDGLYSSFFYADKTRTFFVKSALSDSTVPGYKYYPQIKNEAKLLQKDFSDEAERFILESSDIELEIAANNFIAYFRSYNFPEEMIPEDPGDVVRLGYSLFADFLIAYSVVYSYSLKRYHFKNYYHPFPCLFAKQLYNLGIDGLMKREIQLKNTELGVKYYPKENQRKFNFKAVYAPTNLVLDPLQDSDPSRDYKYYPMEVVDFSSDGSYSQYNWELFYHAPLMIASRLSQNQQFDQARDWYHYIFNPLDPIVTTDSSGNPTPQKFWITKPFFAMQEEDYKKQRIDSILNILSGGDTPEKAELEKQVLFWRSNPFEPHVVAQTRPVAYQKTVIMKYLDNLIAWADQLFRQFSMESINEAIQLYILAAEILGPPQRKVSPKFRPQLLSFNELEGKFDAFSNAAVDLENLVPALNSSAGALPALNPPLPVWLYFCIPQNDKMLGYWDTVADRLYKIRHCMDIDGVVRKLSLFEPPIDPAALVNAIAGGAGLSGALADLNAPTPLYRFNVMLQKANELCNDVKALGGALLSALEKKDAEKLALLRQGQEIDMLNAVREIKEKQIEDAKIVLEGLKKSKEVTQIKFNYYNSLKDELMNTGEKTAMRLNVASTALDASIAVGYILAGGLKLIPNFVIGVSGFGGTPTGTAQTGGESIGSSAENAVKTISAISHALDKGAAIATTVASYQRRQIDWRFQANSAAKELENIEKQIAGAELKIKIAEKELKNHDLQVENAKAVGEFMHSKYTNLELYDWMIMQISQVYFQSYQLAYDLAKRAEKCYQFEIGTDKTYLQFGYWDSLKNGLLSGEKLQFGLRRLESAFLEQNRREFELTKHISLALTHPIQLTELKEKGKCTVSLPEELFDFDYQGHYFRRIKSVSLSIPCIAGPYVTINATLRLLKNQVRVSSSLTGGYARTDDSDMRFRTNAVGMAAVATSSAQNDSGVFELSFRDDRYLPFEGAGAASTWSIELTEDKALQQFDYTTISDAIIHLKYTAREDAGSFKKEAVKHLKAVVKDAADNAQMPLIRFFDIRREFPNEYHAFKSGAAAKLKILLGKDRFPFFAAEAKKLTIRKVQVIGRFDTTNTPVSIDVSNSTPETQTFSLIKQISKFGDELKSAIKDIEFEVGSGNDEWEIGCNTATDLDLMSDLFIAAIYDYK